MSFVCWAECGLQSNRTPVIKVNFEAEMACYLF
jgi:hypothetical protein